MGERPSHDNELEEADRLERLSPLFAQYAEMYESAADYSSSDNVLRQVEQLVTEELIRTKGHPHIMHHLLREFRRVLDNVGSGRNASFRYMLGNIATNAFQRLSDEDNTEA